MIRLSRRKTISSSICFGDFWFIACFLCCAISLNNSFSRATTTTTGWLVLALPQRLSRPLGEQALNSVQSLASQAAQRTPFQKEKVEDFMGMGGVAFSPSFIASTVKEKKKKKKQDKEQKSSDAVWMALANLERDMQMLDRMTGRQAQLSPLELGMLSFSVLAAGAGPLIFGGEITEVLAPSAAAFAASIGIGAEFVGKVAVADGKEVAAASIQCAAEAEGLLANAERAKAVTPLCVGIGAFAATLSLLVPVLLDSLQIGKDNAQMMTEVYLCCPLISILAAAVSNLALQEVRSFTRRAIAVGNRRFSKNNLVARTWLSATEQIEGKSKSSLKKWQGFAWSVLPAPILASLVPGTLPTKTVVAAALAAAESAYFLAQAEFELARATDAVALKARSAAVCDTYANQGARSAAILPFTSALSALCAAVTAAIVELPFVEQLASTGGVIPILSQMAIVGSFPTLGALFSAAASVSKARCEVDAEAATQAASTLALEYDDGPQNDRPVLKPFQSVYELMRLVTNSSIVEPLRRRWKRLSITRIKLWRWLTRQSNNHDGSSQEKGPTGGLVPAS